PSQRRGQPALVAGPQLGHWLTGRASPGLAMGWLKQVFETDGFMPHGFCLVWNPVLIWLHVVSDALIGVAYYSIPVALLYFVARRRDLAFSWLFLLFAAFILLCGGTHFVEIWTLWHPDYALQGMLKAATALVSVGTAIMVWPIL